MTAATATGGVQLALLTGRGSQAGERIPRFNSGGVALCWPPCQRALLLSMLTPVVWSLMEWLSCCRATRPGTSHACTQRLAVRPFARRPSRIDPALPRTLKPCYTPEFGPTAGYVCMPLSLLHDGSKHSLVPSSTHTKMMQAVHTQKMMFSVELMTSQLTSAIGRVSHLLQCFCITGGGQANSVLGTPVCRGHVKGM